MEGRIDEALRYASEPPARSPLPPPPPPTFTAEEIDTALRDRVGRSLRAAVGPVVSADGRTIAGPDAVPIVTVACEAGGRAATVDLMMRTGDNITTEQAILDAWMADGYTPDRALGTNLLYGDEANPIKAATLRGNADGFLHLTIESRCAAG
jgi:hypothetical protein